MKAFLFAPAFFLLAAAVHPAHGQSTQGPPAWWATRGVLVSGGMANDFAPVNLGQLKHMAVSAKAEMEACTGWGSAGAAVDALVAPWFDAGGNPVAGADHFAPANLGQLKAASAPFYDRMHLFGADPGNLPEGAIYPWSETLADDNDFAPANLGQLKHVFSFDFSIDADVPPNGLPDWWERYYFDGQTGINPSGDADGDGLTNLQEWQLRINPTARDSDMDGMLDGWEVGQNFAPGNGDDGAGDADEDGWSNLAEFLAGTDPMVANPTLPGISSEQFGFDDGDRLTGVTAPAPSSVGLDAELNIVNLQ